MRRARTVLLAALFSALLAPAAHAVVPGRFVQIDATNATRVDRLIGFIPIQGIDPKNAGTPVRIGGRRYRLLWLNAGGSTPSLGLTLSNLARLSPSNKGVFADRPLTSKERRRFAVLVDLGRDADVLVAAAGHPACRGISRAAARGIARGSITRWSDAGVSGVEPDAISLRLAGTDTSFTEMRLGSPSKKPARARIEADGGIAAAARGDRSVAAVTSWSRARAWRAGVCAVPLGGVAPTDETVRSLAYPEAYRITFVAARRRPADGLSRAAMRAYVDFLLSSRAGALFERNGMLMVQKRG